MQTYRRLMNTLDDPDDQAAVIHASKVVYKLYTDMFRGLPRDGRTPMRLSEARVVLTGASGGIGLAIATALCASGARVLAVARHRQPLEPLLERYPNNLCWVAADLTSLADRASSGRGRKHRRHQPADQRRRGQSLRHARTTR
jgi:shikimate 5-dehydrogenase